MSGKLTAFVVGGTGSVGRALLADLQQDCAAGALEVRAGVRAPEHAALMAELGATPVQFDLDDRLIDPQRQITALEDADILFLLTGYTVDMLAQSKAMVDAACAAGVRHVIHLGLYAARDTRGIHQSWHQMIECYIQSSGLAWTHLHANWFMSNIYTFHLAANLALGAQASTNHKPVLRGFLPADRRVSWIDTADIAHAAAAVIRDPTDHHAKAYRLAVEALSFDELATMASEVLGQEVAYEQAPLDLLRAFLPQSGIDPEYGKSAVNTIIMTTNGQLPECADVFDDFKRLTSMAPTSWRSVIPRHPEWFGVGSS